MDKCEMWLIIIPAKALSTWWKCIHGACTCMLHSPALDPWAIKPEFHNFHLFIRLGKKDGGRVTAKSSCLLIGQDTKDMCINVHHVYTCSLLG